MGCSLLSDCKIKVLNPWNLFARNFRDFAYLDFFKSIYAKIIKFHNFKLQFFFGIFVQIILNFKKILKFHFYRKKISRNFLIFCVNQIKFIPPRIKYLSYFLCYAKEHYDKFLAQRDSQHAQTCAWPMTPPSHFS